MAKKTNWVKIQKDFFMQILVSVCGKNLGMA